MFKRNKKPTHQDKSSIWQIIDIIKKVMLVKLSIIIVNIMVNTITILCIYLYPSGLNLICFYILTFLGYGKKK